MEVSTELFRLAVVMGKRQLNLATKPSSLGGFVLLWATRIEESGIDLL